MDATHIHTDIAYQDPLDSFEQASIELGADFERTEDDEVRAVFPGTGCDVQVFVTWRPEIDALVICASFDVKAPPARFDAVSRLATLANERLLVGSFDLWSETGIVIHRQSAPLAGGAAFTKYQAVQVLEAAKDACLRFHPAFNFVLWAGKSPQEAMEAALFDTAGEA